jgi:hypothetical protein
MTDTTKTTEPKPERNPDHDAHAAAIYRAMALRFYVRYTSSPA